MATVRIDLWFLSINEEVQGPMPWGELEGRVRAARGEETACVRLQGSEAWKTFRAVATPREPAPPAPPPDPEAQRFCQTAVRLGLLSPAASSRVLEQMRVDRAIGYQKSIFTYVQEGGLLTVDQIASVVAAQKGEEAFAGRSLHEERGRGSALRLASLFPVREWLQDRPWTLRWVQWFAFFALFPVLIGQLMTPSATLRDAVWALGFYYAVISGFMLYLWLRPQSLTPARVLGVAAFTAVIGASLVLSGQKLPIVSNLYAVTNAPNFITRLLGCILGVGILEEGAKAIPLYWLFIHKKQPAELRQCAFLGVVSGLAFGVAEAVVYSYLNAGSHLQELLQELMQTGSANLGTYAQFLVAESTRLISLPLLHGLFAATLGIFIGLAAALPSFRAPLLTTGLALTAALHGTYDAALFSQNPSPWLAFAIALLSLMLFVVYSRSGERILERLKREQSNSTQMIPIA